MLVNVDEYNLYWLIFLKSWNSCKKSEYEKGKKNPLLFQSHDTREKSYFSRIMQGLTFTLGTNENFISNYFSQQNMIPIISDDVTMDTEKDR